jgi:ribose 5-phosphate isomerase B
MSPGADGSGGSLPSEVQIRALVASIVDGLAPRTADPANEPSASPSSAGHDSNPLADVAVGADHGGFALKERIRTELTDHGFSVHDCGTDSVEPVDYPDFAHAVARLVADGGARWGVVVDGAGIGSCIVANKLPGVRAATCWDISSARNSREHNHANVLCLGAGLVGETLALQIVQAWLSTPWGGERHARRVERITEIERRYLARAAV